MNFETKFILFKLYLLKFHKCIYNKLNLNWPFTIKNIICLIIPYINIKFKFLYILFVSITSGAHWPGQSPRPKQQLPLARKPPPPSNNPPLPRNRLPLPSNRRWEPWRPGPCRRRPRRPTRRRTRGETPRPKPAPPQVPSPSYPVLIKGKTPRRRKSAWRTS